MNENSLSKLQQHLTAVASDGATLGSAGQQIEATALHVASATHGSANLHTDSHHHLTVTPMHINSSAAQHTSSGSASASNSASSNNNVSLTSAASQPLQQQASYVEDPHLTCAFWQIIII